MQLTSLANVQCMIASVLAWCMSLIQKQSCICGIRYHTVESAGEDIPAGYSPHILAESSQANIAAQDANATQVARC